MKIVEKRTDRQKIIFLLLPAAAGPKGKILKFDSTPFSPKGGTKYFFMDFYDVNLKKKTKNDEIKQGRGASTCTQSTTSRQHST